MSPRLQVTVPAVPVGGGAELLVGQDFVGRRAVEVAVGEGVG